MAADEATLADILAAERNDVAVLAEACRKRFSADIGLALGAFLYADRRNDDATSPATLQIALATSAGVEKIEFNVQLHPDIVHIYCAKRALDTVRLALVANQF